MSGASYGGSGHSGQGLLKTGMAGLVGAAVAVGAAGLRGRVRFRRKQGRERVMCRGQHCGLGKSTTKNHTYYSTYGDAEFVQMPYERKISEEQVVGVVVARTDGRAWTNWILRQPCAR